MSHFSEVENPDRVIIILAMLLALSLIWNVLGVVKRKPAFPGGTETEPCKVVIYKELITLQNCQYTHAGFAKSLNAYNRQEISLPDPGLDQDLEGALMRRASFERASRRAARAF